MSLWDTLNEHKKMMINDQRCSCYVNVGSQLQPWIIERQSFYYPCSNEENSSETAYCVVMQRL